jgi:hypothetical protein
MNSLKNISKIAGIGYLIIFITGIFANFVVLEGLVDHTNPAETLRNISAKETLFRIGILSFIIMVVFDDGSSLIFKICRYSQLNHSIFMYYVFVLAW